MCGWKAIREQFLKQTILQEVRIAVSYTHLHLIDEVIWSQLEEEYAARTGTFPKVRRTLMRYQNKALEKILRFLHEA